MKFPKSFLPFLLYPFFLFPFLDRAAEYPRPEPGDYIIHDFHFNSGETLPELRLHYRTLGSPQRNPLGVVTNAVLILHGTTGNGSNFLRPEFAGVLFGPAQL